MRVPPMLSVELDGQVVRRPGQVEVLLYDQAGRPAVTRVRPQLEDGEQLVERTATIPVIVRTTA